MAELDLQPKLMVGEGWADFALLDSGHGRKLEQYGPHRFVRPEPQAMWTPRLADWRADAEFVPGSDEDGGGRWMFDASVPRDGWELGWNDVRFTASCTPFRHLGFFPDMAPVWDWMGEQLLRPREGGDLGPDSAAYADGDPRLRGDASTLNLFGYTGVGTLALSQHGPVTHVDASKKSVAQARANAQLSGMTERPVRWIVDDAAKFTAREVRRGKRYDGIILDPPKFGRGPDGEVWRLEESLPGLVADCAQLLDADSRFLFLTVYAVRMSSLAIAGLLAEALKDMGGTIEHGDLAIREQGEGGRLLPTAIFARWKN
ncbi:MAG: SAM-dependent methyltransferase [Novosphingobium sp. 16-62-11]|uniref:class I SAM-dependent methyltransferase n=1 Tax=Novosphingobium sp. 17-62-19 TaxID=1970406 RepID=UPI000BD1D7CD|nr:class I SAM-dependent methyltransferase [Novosphingobium sp. 17-62-19]OYX93388.1 MAG: SAM-dependent methyltransferase [Novosphingobium sp. 35-62-5]OYZ44889.1 MAG: SAM-dependent methyltransferase [Novosphingobium sp. 16-62-11]OZA20930.1 MAG: SAM-dependent methyltransferase [Novosphingobium sp. 17-62-19]HQS97450.1 class I SAM-dependent methyltransferase [Novosphingobium sp.]